VRGLAPAPGLEVLHLGELVVVDHREVEHDLACVFGARREEVALGPEPEAHRGDDLSRIESSGGLVTWANCWVK
jgi:hypothetical protein